MSEGGSLPELLAKREGLRQQAGRGCRGGQLSSARQVREAEARVAELRARAESKLREDLTLPEPEPGIALGLRTGEGGAAGPVESHEATQAWERLPRDYDFANICDHLNKLCADAGELHQRLGDCEEKVRLAS